MLKYFLKYSQAIPMPGVPQTGIPSVPTAAPGGGSEPSRPEIGSPLDSLAKVLYDVDVQTFIKNNFGENADTLAKLIWQEYGGDNMGLNALPDHTGKRVMKQGVSDDVKKAEHNATEHTRWERLPLGKNIAQVISPNNIGKAFQILTEAISGIIVNMATTKEQAGGGGAGGILGGGGFGGPPIGGPPPEAPPPGVQ